MRHRYPLSASRGLTLAVAAFGAVAALSLSPDLAFAQDPPETIPPTAKREIRDLKYIVQDLAARIDDLRVNETEIEYRIELAADVLFDFDRSNIKAEAEQVLTRAAGFIRDRAVGTVRIEGHTDAKGTEAYNLRLSERRAAAVRIWLVGKGGLGSTSFSTEGFGATKPVAPNTMADGSDDPDGRQKNRRVEIVIAKKR